MSSSDPEPPLTETLIQRAREGDQEAWDRLFGAISERALLFLRLRLGNKLRQQVDSMDVLQDAYDEAWRGMDRFEFRGHEAFNRWFCRILENRVRMLAQHHGARKRTPEGEREHLSRIIDRAASVEGPKTVVARRERSERLGAAIESLPEDERQVLLLRFFQEHTIDQIADLTGRSATAVRRLLGKATLRLGRDLEDPGV